MAQTAAHLVDHVIPPVRVRRWVISVPKRLRGFLADRPQDRYRPQAAEAPTTADWDMVCADARKTPPQGVRGVLANHLRTAGPPC
jgi:hypothetical protein